MSTSVLHGFTNFTYTTLENPKKNALFDDISDDDDEVDLPISKTKLRSQPEPVNKEPVPNSTKGKILFLNCLFLCI